MLRSTLMLVVYALAVFTSAVTAVRAGEMERITADSEQDLRETQSLAWRSLRPSHSPLRIGAEVQVPARDQKGLGAGFTFEVPMNGSGLTAPVSIAQAVLYSEPNYDPITDAWKKKVFTEGPSAGLRQRLVRVGVGDKTGDKGAFLEPYLGGGVGLGSWKTMAAQDRDGPYYRLGKPDQRLPHNLTPYWEAGADVIVNNFAAVGVRVQNRDFRKPSDPMAGAPFVGANLTFIMPVKASKE